MSKTSNLGLTLTGNSDADTNQTFLAWRNAINGEGSGSNMRIIDAAVGEMQEQIDDHETELGNKGEGLEFDDSTNLLYLINQDGERIGDGVPVAAAGNDFHIEDVYATLAALRTAFPNGNNYAYQVTEENDEIFIWSKTESDWVSIGPIRGAKGDTGNGIASVTLNNDYTLTVAFTNGTSATTTSIRGATGDAGNGIASVTLNNDYTMTIVFTDGTSTTTTSVRGATGEGVASGGTTGQMLVKLSNTDYDADWADVPGTVALSLTAAATSWQGSPATITLTAAGVTASNDILVGIGGNLTSAQYEAVQNAGIACTAQAANSITLTAFDETPTVNIPITVLILP